MTCGTGGKIMDAWLLFAVLTAGCVGDRARAHAATAQVPAYPVMIETNVAGHAVADFGKHAFGWLEVDVAATGRYEIVWGELLNDLRAIETNRFYTVDRGTVRCACSTGVFEKVGIHRIPLQEGNGSSFYRGAWNQFFTPEGYGNVMPFRWAEIVELPFPVRHDSLRQVAVRYPYNLEESRFCSSSEKLNRVYDFCKYSIAATSFLGRFVDGDRERLAYEGDSLIAQLGSYAMSSDYTVPRATLDWVSEHSTWPTEWKQHFVSMCWFDWMYSGDTSRIRRYYELMRKSRIWSKCARADGLLVTDWKKGRGDDEPRDIVDWAMCYRDGFVFSGVNAVVNALRYRNLLEMCDMASAIDKTDDAASFNAEARRVRSSYIKAFVDPESGLVRDGEGVNHFTVQGNAMALVCGVLPPENTDLVADFIVRKGMSCSTYMAQFVLEALCRSGRIDEALELMTTEGARGWLSMMEKGATITMEFWDLTLAEKWRKPDMNHAWSTAPLNIITRYILGVTPLEPGFKKISLRPLLGKLSEIKARIPTAAGRVDMSIINTSEGYEVKLDIPSPAELAVFGTVRKISPGSHQFVFKSSRKHNK